MDFDTLVDITWSRWHDLTLERYGNTPTLSQMFEVAQDAARWVADDAGLPPLAVTLYGELKGVLVRLGQVGEVVVEPRVRPTVLH